MAGQAPQDDAGILALLEEKDQLQTELDRCRVDLEKAVQQLQVYFNYNEAFQAKIANLERELKKQNGTLRQEIEDLSRELAEVELHNQASIRRDLAQLRYLFHNSEERQNELRERELLLQRIEILEIETHKWKNEAFGRGNKAVSTCWQASVDQAIMRERAKDSWAIKHLQDDIRRLRAERLAEAASRVGMESLLVKSLRAEIRLLKGGIGNGLSSRDPWQQQP